MKNKSVVIAILIMCITIALGLGLEHINDISAYERLEKMMSYDIPIKSLRSDISGTMQFDMPQEVKELTPMLSEEIIIGGYTEAIYDPNNLQMLTFESIDMSGMKFEISTFYNHDEIFIKYPIIGKPLYICLTDIEKITGVNIPREWLSKLYTISLNMNTNFAKSIIENINPEHISYGDNIEFEQYGYSQTLKNIIINLDSEDMIAIAKAVVSDTINDKELNEFAYEILDYIAQSNDIPEDELTELKDNYAQFKEHINKFIDEGDKSEEIKEIIDSKEFKEFYNVFKQFMDKSTIQIELGVNNMNMPLYVGAKTDIKITDTESNMEFGIKYDIEQKLSKINEINSIDSSKFSKDNCLPLIDFIKDELPNIKN